MVVLIGNASSEESTNNRRITLTERYGSYTAHLNTDEAKMNRKTTNINKYGSISGRLHEPEVEFKARKTAAGKYDGDPFGMIHTEEAKAKAHEEYVYITKDGEYLVAPKAYRSWQSRGLSRLCKLSDATEDILSKIRLKQDRIIYGRSARFIWRNPDNNTVKIATRAVAGRRYKGWINEGLAQ